MAEYHCTYKKEFPVDEYGRLGGLYSLVDLPIAKHEEMTRTGIIKAKNEESQMFKICDIEKNFTEWVSMENVTIVQDDRKLLNG